MLTKLQYAVNEVFEAIRQHPAKMIIFTITYMLLVTAAILVIRIVLNHKWSDALRKVLSVVSTVVLSAGYVILLHTTKLCSHAYIAYTFLTGVNAFYAAVFVLVTMCIYPLVKLFYDRIKHIVSEYKRKQEDMVNPNNEVKQCAENFTRYWLTLNTQDLTRVEYLKQSHEAYIDELSQALKDVTTDTLNTAKHFYAYFCKLWKK